MTPPTVNVWAVVVTVVPAPSATPPVPKFKSLVPVNVKLPFQVCALLLESVIASAVVLSIVVPAAIEKLPVPKAVALLMFSVPAESVVPPE